MARPTRLTRQQQTQIRALLVKHEPLIRQAFEAAIQNARGALDFNELVQAIQSNNLDRAAQLLRLNQAVLWPLEEAIRTAFYAGGTMVVLPKGIAGAFSFNGRHPRAEQIIADVGARLVSEIGSPGPDVIRVVLLQGQKDQVGAQTIARRLSGTVNPRTGIREGGIMGLDGPRAQRSARVREILSDPGQIGEYFKGSRPRFTSTDRRFDAKVRAAIAQGKALPKADIERITKLHDARLLKARGETIARAEAYTAQAQGRNEAYRQMIDAGLVESVTKRWQHATAKDPRHDHAAFDGKERGMDEAFVMDDGTQMQYPHDPDAGPQHKIGCRCSVIYIPQFRRPVR